MSALLSVVIASHNDPFLHQTVQSILGTSGCYCEVVVVDDGSNPKVQHLPKDVKLIRNPERRGVGPSRHKGVLHASAPLILITDAHMLFAEGWFQPTVNAMNTSDKLMLCGQTIGLHETDTDLSHPKGVYNGARMVLCDPNAEPRWRILCPKWAEDKPGQDFYPLSAVMGALYVMHKSFYLKIGGLRLLREFGGDEEMLSLKVLRAGGDIRMFKPLKAGHRFRTKTQPPYRILEEVCVYNSLALAHVCCPKEVVQNLHECLGDGALAESATIMLHRNMPEIAAERDALLPVWMRTWPEYLNLIASIDRKG